MTADLFTQAEAPDWVAAATKRGATFAELAGLPQGTNRWSCAAPLKRGQQLPIVTFHHTTQAQAAEAFCRYFHVKP